MRSFCSFVNEFPKQRFRQILGVSVTSYDNVMEYASFSASCMGSSRVYGILPALEATDYFSVVQRCRERFDQREIKVPRLYSA